MAVDPQSTDKSSTTPWLSIVGIGVDGSASLTARAAHAIEDAELVIGSSRQLASVSTLLHKATATWPSPLAQGIEQLLARRGRPTCVLASGDPFFYGIGATLSPHLTPGEFVCHPSPSSLSLAAARLAWPLQDVDVVSLHGRALHNVIRYLQPGRRVLALSWDRNTPRALSTLLNERGFGESTLTVLESLGGVDERVRRTVASQFALDDIDDLNLVALEVRASTDALIIPTRGSLPDDAFENDGQLTKRDVRALTLSALAPRPGELLWDVGAGAGSIAIEWMLSHPTCGAVAIERDPTRAARIARNAERLGTPTLRVVEARAPEGLADLPTPDVVFIGGGAGDRALIDYVWSALRPGGRLVVNSVSLETEALLVALHGERGGELRRFTIESAVPLGTMRAFRPAMSIVQWRVEARRDSQPMSAT